MEIIQAKQHRVIDVFSDKYSFHIPSFQRPYSWGAEQASELLSDLTGAAKGFNPNEKTKKAVVPYFLGSIVLIKQENDPDAKVIDGQQRLTTLALLMSALRVKLPTPENRDAVWKRLFQKGNSIEGTKDGCRITLRERDHGFFEANILSPANLDALEGLLNGSLPDPQRRLAQNGLYFYKQVDALKPEDRDALAAFILQHTFLVLVSTPDLESAFRIFSVLNDRGLDLTVADILKAEITGEIKDEKEQDNYVEQWEDAEEELGTARFADLFSHIRMIYGRSKLRKTVLEGFRESVNAAARPKEFIDADLIPFADAYSEIVDAKYESADKLKAVKINQLVRLLDRMGDRDWVPPALLYLRNHHDEPDNVLAFFTDLERLAAALWLMRIDESGRIDRYGRLLTEIANSADLKNEKSALQLTASEKEAVVTVLNGNIYELTPKPKRTMVLLRLDQALSSGEASYEFDRITVEHVLPQNPPELLGDGKPSNWVVWWPDAEQRGANVHRLGNLALLNRRQNSAAKNWEFDVKKEKYFRTQGGASPFVITTEVVKQNEWTPAQFEERQNRFVARLKEVWRLN
jgi:hypothetical protein